MGREEKSPVIEYDETSGYYFVICTPVPVAGLGRTKQEAMEDLQEAARFAMECDLHDLTRDTA